MHLQVRRRVLMLAATIWSVCLAASGATAQPVNSAAATIEVTSAADAGSGSYRAAVQLANANGDTQPDVIDFTPGLVIALTSGSVSYSGTQPLTLNGHGSTVDGSGAHQILTANSAAAITLRDLTLRDAGSASGGAVSAFNSSVDAERTTFTNNRSDVVGGAIAAATIRVVDSTFIDNRAVFGGALEAGDLDITRSTFLRNDSAIGGAVVGGDATIRSSVFAENTAAIGAVAAVLAADVAGSIFDRNAAAGGVGGAIVTFLPSHVATSLFAGNSAAVGGGIVVSGNTFVISGVGPAVSVAPSDFGAELRVGAVTATLETGGVGASQFDLEVDVAASTFTRDRAVAGGSIAGGETIVVTNGAVTEISGAVAVTATNVTFAGERADESGGAIAVPDGTVALRYVTAADNGAPNGAHVRASELTTFGSLFGPTVSGANCAVTTATSSGFNYSTDSSCALGATSDSQNSGDPRLEALDAFGGATPTRPPVAGSPLVDAIPGGACDPAVRVDQRGTIRPQPGVLGAPAACDIGAVEITALLPSFTG